MWQLRRSLLQNTAAFAPAAGGGGGGGSQTARYWRFYVTENQGDTLLQFSEFQLLDSGGARIGTSPAAITSPGSGNPPGSGEGAIDALDNNTATKMFDSNFAANGYTQLIIDFGSDLTAYGYRWYTANDSATRDPKSWTVSTSPDGSTWTVVHTVTNATANATRFALTGPYSF